jgi:predicted naringenin-chalcone synthase
MQNNGRPLGERDRTGALAVLGLGTALPPRHISQADTAALVNTFWQPAGNEGQMLSVLFRRAGVRTRHLALLEGERAMPFYPAAAGADDHGPTTAARMQRYFAEVGPLAAGACRKALDRSGLSAAAITHLVTVTCTGFASPGVDFGLITDLGLPRTVRRTQIGFMGCHGALNGLQTARAIVGADPAARVLLCAVELCSVHFRYNWDPEQTVANALFADGAAALVAAPPVLAPAAWQAAATGSCLFPDSADDMTWRVGDHGFEMTLSARVPDLLRAHLRPWLDDWLGQNHVGLGAVGSWAVHPGGPRILAAVAETLGLPRDALEASREVLEECGNMSSPTVLFILERLQRRQAPRPCVALAFGPGLVAEAALFL